MGGLAHLIEAQGIATTQISLIREHSESIRPPRALWVSFPLGRPLGVPGDPDFQRDVLIKAFALLNHSSGPVLVDYPRDVEQPGGSASVVTPQGFSARSLDLQEITTEQLLAHWRAEVTTLGCIEDGEPGVSGLTVGEIIRSFSGYLQGTSSDGGTFPSRLRLAAEDLKSAYFLRLALLDNQTVDSALLADWLWGETWAGLVINRIREKALQEADENMQMLGKLLLVPRNQLHRFRGKFSKG